MRQGAALGYGQPDAGDLGERRVSLHKGHECTAAIVEEGASGRIVPEWVKEGADGQGEGLLIVGGMQPQ